MSLRNSRIVLIGGVHGVGKSELCKELSVRLGVDHVTASQLIKQYTNRSVDNQKQVDSLIDNQTLLIKALYHYRSSSSGIILDGHFCLLGQGYIIQEIPVTVFRKIRMSAAVVLTGYPNIIQSRLQSRGNPVFPLGLIEQFQSSEIHHATLVCQTLAIPILILDPQPDMDEATAFLKYHLLPR